MNNETQTQRIWFDDGRLEHEVVGKAIAVSFHCLVEDFRRHGVEFRKVAIKHDFVPADKVNPALDQLNWNRQPIGQR